jgi:hypothetical protein
MHRLGVSLDFLRPTQENIDYLMHLHQSYPEMPKTFSQSLIIPQLFVGRRFEGTPR